MTAAIRIHHPQPRRTERRVHDLRERRTTPVRGVRRRPSEATFRRRRAIVGTTLAVLVAVGAVATHDVLAGSGGDPASAAASQPAHVTSIVASPGDTLWSIAGRFRGDVSISRYVDTLVDLNGGASIEAGQKVVLP
jgi:hypothetical protein